MPGAGSQLQVPPTRRHRLLCSTHRASSSCIQMLLQVLGWMLVAHTGTFPKLQHKSGLF